MRNRIERFILNRDEWDKACLVLKRWLAALIRCRRASRLEVDYVFDLFLDRLASEQIITDADFALELIKNRMSFAIFAGICFASPEDAAEAAARSARDGEKGEAREKVLANFAKARKTGGKIDGIEFKMARFTDIYAVLPFILQDDSLMMQRKTAIARWRERKNELVPDLD